MKSPASECEAFLISIEAAGPAADKKMRRIAPSRANDGAAAIPPKDLRPMQEPLPDPEDGLPCLPEQELELAEALELITLFLADAADHTALIDAVEETFVPRKPKPEN